MRAGLDLEQAPPASVPFRFFLSAPAFGVLAGLGLAWAGADALATRWSPVTLALTHLLTLGFATMVASGALFQMLPVLTGVAVPRPRPLAATVHGALVLGTLALVLGLLGVPALLPAALALLGVAFAALLAGTLVALVRIGARRNATVRGLRLALGALAVAVVLGLARLAAWGLGLGVPMLATDLHVAWALIGWIGLLIVSVSFQVVPMFQITPEYPRWMRTWLVPAVLGLLAVWSLGVVLGSPSTERLARLGVGTGIASWALTTIVLQRRRRRRIPEVTMGYWRLGTGSAMAAAVLWVLGDAAGPADRRELLTGVLVLVGAAQSIIHGMLYKIVPFLVWLHGRSRPDGVKSMSRVVPDVRVRRQLWLHAGALLALVAAVLAPVLAPFAGAVYALSCAALGYDLWSAARRLGRVAVAAPVRS